MEVISGKVSIKYILKHNANWHCFYSHFKDKIRISVVANVAKVLACGTELMGFHQYTCPCGQTKRVAHTCKSRFCNSCGKKMAEQWIQKQFDILPKTTWQHITFTMPREFWNLFWLNRDLFNNLSTIAASIILDVAKNKKCTPGIFTALHTFGRDLKRNVHIHLSTTKYGLSYDQSKKIKLYFSWNVLMPRWRYAIIDLLREAYKQGKLTLTNKLNHIKNSTAFNSWLNVLYAKDWVVHFSQPTDDHKRNIEYFGRYVKRPPIAESRILEYKNGLVTIAFYDHHSKEHSFKSFSSMAFIERLINHIPDKGFHLIRYYGILASRVRGKLLTAFEKLIGTTKTAIKKLTVKWRQLIIGNYGKDPLECPQCKNTMTLSNIQFPISNFDLLGKAEELFRQVLFGD